MRKRLSINYSGLTAALAAAFSLAACSGIDGALRSDFPTDQAAQMTMIGDPIERGKRDFAAGRYGRALTHFQAALRGDPDSVRALNAVAAAYDQMGRFDLADRYYDHALTIEPESVDVLNNIGFSHILRGDTDTGVRYLRLAAAVDGDNSTVDRNLRLALGEPVEPQVIGNPLYTLADLAQVRGRVVARAPEDDTAITTPNNLAAAAPVDDGEPRARLVRVARGVQELQTVVGAERARMATSVAARDQAVADLPAVKPAEEPVLAALEEDAEPAPPPAADSAADLSNGPTLVIANGTGRPGMAARLSDYLSSNGVEPTGISNEESFDRMRSVIRYRPDSAAMAEALAAKLPIEVAIEPDPDQVYHLRLILGADLLDLDDQLLNPAVDVPTG